MNPQPPPWELRPSEVRVWVVSFDASDEDVARFMAVISPDERRRAERFRFEHLKRSYTITHGALRILIGRYTTEPPQAIRFSFGERGKPALTGRGIHFNISHCDSLALLAFARDFEIGVDVECIDRRIDDYKAIARRLFHPEEFAEMMSFPPAQRRRAFFLCWTRKEAIVKALGEGLHQPLESFRVSLERDSLQSIRLLGPGPSREWSLHNLDLGSGYAAAVACTGAAAPRASIAISHFCF